MPGWRWQRTYSQTEKMWRCFKDLPEALGFYSGKGKIYDLIFWSLVQPNVIKQKCDVNVTERHWYHKNDHLNIWILLLIGLHCCIHLCFFSRFVVVFYVLFLQNGPIISRDTGRCLEVEMSKDANFGLRLVVQRCSGQKWMIRNWIKHPRHWSQSTTSGTLCAVFKVAAGSLMLDSSERSRTCWCECVVFHTAVRTTHWASLRPQSCPTQSLKDEYDQFKCFTELCVHRDLAASCAVWNDPHFWHSAPCIEQRNKTPECSPYGWSKILVILLFLL